MRDYYKGNAYHSLSIYIENEGNWEKDGPSPSFQR